MTPALPHSDLVVVGAGPGGIACALFAAARGRSVVLLEKADRIGGTLHWSGGHLSAAGTRRQAARGIVDDADAHYADIVRISRGTVRPELTRLAVNLAVPVVEWLEDLGFEYDDSTPRIVYGHEPYTTPRTVHGVDGGRSVLAVLEPALSGAVADGAVRLELGTRVAELLHEGGRVVGVRAEDGRDWRAQVVVLGSGGFGHDPELFAELDGAPLVTSAAPTSTGDGVRMARAVGAGIAGRGMYIPTFGGLPPEPGELRVDWVNRPHLVAPERPPWEIYVDRGGRRWIDEDEPSIDRKERVLTTIEDMTFWQVFDARALEESRPMVHGWEPAELDAACGVRRGVERADDLEALAERAGIDGDGLAATVERYNSFVASGVDADFGRRFLPAPIAVAPFYAIENHPVTLITFAGVDVDEQLRVRRVDGSVVEGLFAIGELIGSAVYNGNSFCSGMALTPALAFGRYLGLTL